MNEILFVVLIIIGYLMGSLCSAIIVSRIFSLPDPLKEGSKNPGATNVLRLAGKKYAAIVMLFDMLKGVIPVLIAKMIGVPALTIAFTALAAVLGHMYPVFFNFKGGKGVATAMGALLAFHFMLGIIVIATWLLVAKISRYSSLASMTCMVAMPLYAMLMKIEPSAFPPLFFIMLFILYQHRNNITRLTDGTEPKFNFSSTVAASTETTSLTPEPEVKEVKEEKPKTSPKKKAPAKKTTKAAAESKTSAKTKATGSKTTTAKKSATTKKTTGTAQKKTSTASKSSTAKKKTSTAKKAEPKKTSVKKEDK